MELLVWYIKQVNSQVGVVIEKKPACKMVVPICRNVPRLGTRKLHHKRVGKALSKPVLMIDTVFVNFYSKPMLVKQENLPDCRDFPVVRAERQRWQPFGIVQVQSPRIVGPSITYRHGLFDFW